MKLNDLDESIRVMNKSTFCHPDRFKDAVSKQVLDAMKRSCCQVRAIAVSLAVRYKSSPRDLASKLAKVPANQFKECIYKHLAVVVFTFVL